MGGKEGGAERRLGRGEVDLQRGGGMGWVVGGGEQGVTVILWDLQGGGPILNVSPTNLRDTLRA